MLPTSDPATGRVRDIYDRWARRSDPMADGGWFLADGRRWLCSQARGATLEIGIGSGRNIRFYPPDVRLTGIELSPGMLALARRRAVESGRTVHLVEGDAAELPFGEASFDTVVFSQSLCSIPDDRRAIAEAARMLRPGGRLVALEHVRSPNRFVRGFERLAEPIALRFSADHLLRDPLDHLAAVGLVVEHLERRRAGLIERLVASRPTEEPGPPSSG
jgi:SAM-dependent methyltransferase